jgi:2-C-methyl-D-erythritol 2,4-cyclodiphosphate synthase
MMRVGLGYDIHRLVPGRSLILGGVDIPFSMGLEGHSDADVIIHALMDAILGAAGLGDIGQHFPPSEDCYRDISSLMLLARVRQLIEQQGFHLVNLDIVLVAEKPKIAEHAGRMRQRIAAALGVEPSVISVKATTNEGVGPEGRGEAMSARAVALLSCSP